MIAPHLAAVEYRGWVFSETAISTRGVRWDLVKSARVVCPVSGVFLESGIWYSLEKPRVRVRAPTERITMDEYRWRSAQFDAIGVWKRKVEYAPMP